jgi:predicted transcriptional regulator
VKFIINGELLNERRYAQQYSIQELAEMLKVEGKEIHAAENGSGELGLDFYQLGKLVNILSIQSHELSDYVKKVVTP